MHTHMRNKQAQAKKTAEDNEKKKEAQERCRGKSLNPCKHSKTERRICIGGSKYKNKI